MEKIQKIIDDKELVLEVIKIDEDQKIIHLEVGLGGAGCGYGYFIENIYKLMPYLTEYAAVVFNFNQREFLITPQMSIEEAKSTLYELMGVYSVTGLGVEMSKSAEHLEYGDKLLEACGTPEAVAAMAEYDKTVTTDYVEKMKEVEQLTSEAEKLLEKARKIKASANEAKSSAEDKYKKIIENYFLELIRRRDKKRLADAQEALAKNKANSNG